MELWQLALIWGFMAIVLLVLVVVLIRRVMAGRATRASMRGAYQPDRPDRPDRKAGGRSRNSPPVRKRQLSERLVVAEVVSFQPVVEPDYYTSLERRLEDAFNGYVAGELTLDGFDAAIVAESDDLAQRHAALLVQPVGDADSENLRAEQLDIITAAQEALAFCTNWARQRAETPPPE